MEQDKKELRFKMFGRFSVVYDGRELKLDKSGTSKMIQLLSTLVYYKNGLPRETLLRNLYGDKELADRNNNLRVTLFKLRKMLVQAGLPTSNYITLTGDIYRLSNDVPMTCDVWEFQQCVIDAGLAQDEKDEEREISLRRRACALYGGELLPAFSCETWVMMEAVPLKHMYTACLGRLCDLLEARQRYREIVELCSAAELIYPFDEWQIMGIDALMAMGQYDEAFTAYDRFTSLYFEELGISPTEEMLARYEKLCNVMQREQLSAAEIFESLMGKDSVRAGGMFVSYPSFIDRFRFLQRLSERSGESNFLVVSTLQHKSGKALEVNDNGSTVDEKVREVLNRCLRRTDSFTKFNASQYLLLLVGLDQNSIEIITRRIDEGISKAQGLRLVSKYSAIPLDHPEGKVMRLGWNTVD